MIFKLSPEVKNKGVDYSGLGYGPKPEVKLEGGAEHVRRVVGANRLPSFLERVVKTILRR